jgi:hypothetical protein
MGLNQRKIRRRRRREDKEKERKRSKQSFDICNLLAKEITQLMKLISQLKKSV